MEKVTEADFEKVRKYAKLSLEPTGGPRGASFEQQIAIRQAYEEAKPATAFLVNYFYTKVEPDNGERNPGGSGDRPYNLTKTERALNYLNEYEGLYDLTFIEKYSDLIETAMQHYEKNVLLPAALSETLENITGAQLLLLLKEYERRKKDSNE